MNLMKVQSLLQGKNIIVTEWIDNTKASEYYIRTRFIQDDNGSKWDTVVPYIDRRAGLNIVTEEELVEYLISIKPYFRKEAMDKWRVEEQKRGLIGGSVTKPFFDVLLSFKEEIENLPANNNGARRIQDIKDAGYTIASVPNAKDRMTSRILLPIPVHGEMGYENFAQIKARIIRLLNGVNAYEAKPTAKKSLIPDHKFSEVRWDEDTKAENPDTMSDSEIIQKFQLLDNQRNEQKREVCRKCFQEGIRGTIYGIKYFYKGTEKWDDTIPVKGKAAEKGCEGCPWYDIEEWRRRLNNEVKK